MSFRNLNIKYSYINHGSNNVMSGLICPALKHAKVYKRSVGYFSSSVFKLLENSLPDFIRNQGKIKMIVSPELSEEDVNAISLGYEKKSFVEKNFISNFENELSKFEDQSLNTLYELVLNGVIDFKIACTKNSYGIYHDKLGILEDIYGDKIIFYGSANSSYNAYQNNYEKVRVIKSWDSNDIERIFDEINEFDSMWDNRNEFLEVYSFDESIRKSIIKEVERRHISTKKNNEVVELYDYQKEAIEAWVNNSYKGFYVMATGTGKTFTAIYSLKRLIDNTTVNPFVLITAPYIHLLRQWEYDLKRVFPDSKIHLVYSENDWKKPLIQSIISQSYGKKDLIIVIATMKSFNENDDLHKIIDKSTADKLLIVDEAHRFTKRKDIFKEKYKYLLGLSATPINGKNNVSGHELIDYFGGCVINLPIEVALEKGFLVSYYYKPLYVSATESEEIEFRNITNQIMGCYKDGKLIDENGLIKFTKARLRTISMATEKIDKIDDLIREIKEKDHFILYCGDGKVFDEESEQIKHINFVKKHLNKFGFRTSQFTASEKMDLRMQLIDLFNYGELDSLVAIRCLDEGINIPSIKSALIFSSNDDYREFVQRRGRILRKYKDKKYATIYDVVVLPSSTERNFAKIELRRFYEYARLALNKEDKLEELNNLLTRYNLKKEDVLFDLDLEIEGELIDE